MQAEPPLCECHGERMRWVADHRIRSRGYWRCRVRRAEVDAKRWKGYEERMPPLVRMRKDLASHLAYRRRARKPGQRDPKLAQALLTVRRGN